MPITLETEHHPEVAEIEPRKFGAIVALGKNWRLPVTGGPRIDLSIESKMTALAAAEMYRAGLANKIIFSTGKTAGKDAQGNEYPTEAEAMYKFMRIFFSPEEIQDSAVILETTSFDTAGNAEEVKKIMQEKRIDNIALLTVGYHLPRAKRLFKNYGINVKKAFRSEKVLAEKRPRYANFYNEYLWRRKVLRGHLKPLKDAGVILGKEAVASGLAFTVDPLGKGITRKITAKSRHREAA